MLYLLPQAQASLARQYSHKLPVGGPCLSHGQQSEVGCCGQGSQAGRLDGAILSYGGGAGLGSEPAWGLPLSPGCGGGRAEEGIAVSACISQNGLMGQTEAHLIRK